MFSPQIVQSSSAQRAACHDALHFGTIDNLPRFADALLRRKLFVKFRFEAPPAPYSLDENRLEGEGTHDCKLLIADCRFQIGKFVGRFCETPSI
jgi:hypothetical protein